MFKKIFLAGLAIAAGMFILNHTRLGSYGHTAWNKAKSSVKGQVPLEFEIERVRDQLQQLMPDMNKNLNEIAKEVVAVDNLRDEIKVARENLTKQKDLVRQMTEDLKTGNEKITYRGIRYPRERISERLANDIKSCVRCEDELKARESLLEHKERALEAAKEQVASIRSQRKDLEVQIAQLEAELKAVRLAQTKSTIQLDDSRLSHIKASIKDIQNRMKVERVRGDMEAQFSNDPTIKVEKKKSAEEVIKDAEAYLEGGEKSDAKADVRK